MNPYVIGIAGGTGSGKTTLANRLAKEKAAVGVVVISFDDYYKDQPGTTLEERAKTNYDHPDSLDADLLVSQLVCLKAGKPIERPVYDFATHSRLAKTVRINPAANIIVEGILVLHFKTLRDLFDLRLYVDAPADIRFMRRLSRDVRERGRTMDSVIDQYLATVRPMHEQFVEPSKQWADRVVSGTSIFE